MSEVNSFKSCLVDGDTEVLARARRLRQKAIAISLALEAMLIAAMLIWPLITPAVLSRQYVVTPTPPYGSHSAPNATNHRGGQPHPERNIPHPGALHQPPVIPTHVPDSASEPALDSMLGSRRGEDRGFDSGDPGLVDGPGDARTVMPPIAPPPPPPAPKVPVKRSEGVMEAQLIRRVQPAYPKMAIDIRLSGAVQLRAIIGVDGRVRQVEVLSGSPLLSRSAQDAVRQWVYRPTMLNGSAVEVETLITVRFVLE